VLSGPFGGTALLDAVKANIVLSVLNQYADTELLANPRVVTTDNGKAKINITQQYPIPSFTFSETTASFQINGFIYKDIGIILNVMPHINNDGFISMDIAPEVSSSTATVPFSSGNGTAFNIPIIDTRQAATTVLIKSGNTLAMGGLIREDVADSYTTVPIMGDIPGLGAFFRSKSLSKVKRNLLIFLTPTIVKPDAANPTGLEQYSNGLPPDNVFTNDKWMPKDNAKPRQFITFPPSKPKRTTPVMSDTPVGADTPDAPASATATPSKVPTTNFVPGK
jgi:type II secretory pathway component GspD/PulD (secretin)